VNLTLFINDESNSREPKNEGFYQVKMGKVTPTKIAEENDMSNFSSTGRLNKSWAQVSEIECEHNVAAIISSKFNLTPKTGA